MPFSPLFWEGSPTKIDYRKKVGTLILSSLLEDLDNMGSTFCGIVSPSDQIKDSRCGQDEPIHEMWPTNV